MTVVPGVRRGQGRDPRGWVPALRIARRSLRRHLGRSLLVVALVAVPIGGATTIDVVLRTVYNPERSAFRAMGAAAALAVVTPFERLAGWRPQAGGFSYPDGDHARDASALDLHGILPAGTRVVEAGADHDLTVLGPSGPVGTSVRVSAVGDPLTGHEVVLRSGRLPEAHTDVLVTPALGERLGLLAGDDVRAGAVIRIADGPLATVSGIGVLPACLSCEGLIAPRDGTVGALVADLAPRRSASFPSMPDGRTLLLDLPEGTDVDALWPELARHGVALVPRDVHLDPARYRDGRGPPDVAAIQTAGVIALVVVFGVLQVVLLAGAAFAVGARRQVHDLGLVAACGGTPRQVGRVVLAQGVVLGAAGALSGILAGGALAVLGKPVWERLGDELLGGWHVGWVEIAAVGAVGLVSGLAAALLPAVGAARMQPVDALAQRFRSTPITTRLPVLGVRLLVGGAGGALVIALLSGAEYRDYARRVEEAAGTGTWVQQPSTGLAVTMQVLGAVAAVAGLMMLVPWLVSVLARRGRRLPLSGRLAVRDAARQRHRTVPATTAIMIVVATSVGLGFALAGADRADELRYTPNLPPGVVQVEPDPFGAGGAGTTPGRRPAPGPRLAAATAALTAALPWATVHEIAYPVFVEGDGRVPAYVEVYQRIWLPASERALEACTETRGDGEVVSVDRGCDIPSALLAVGTPALLELATGREPDPRTLRALAEGRAVVFDERLLDEEGNVTVRRYDPGTGEHALDIALPAHVTEREHTYLATPGAFVAAEALRRHPELGSAVMSALVTYPAGTPEEDVEAALAAAGGLGTLAGIERGRVPHAGPIGMALTGIAAFVTLAGVAVAVALAAAEGRADAVTLAAVGAQPRRRRTLAGAQALVIGGVGTALGLLLGAYFAALTYPMTGSPDFVVPWRTLAVTGAVVPLLAVAVAMLCTPGRLPMVRRVA